MRRLEHEADTADFPAICHASDAKDITRDRRETRQRFERSLENKISRQRKRSEFETIRTLIQLFDEIRFHSDAIRS